MRLTALALALVAMPYASWAQESVADRLGRINAESAVNAAKLKAVEARAAARAYRWNAETRQHDFDTAPTRVVWAMDEGHGIHLSCDPHGKLRMAAVWAPDKLGGFRDAGTLAWRVGDVTGELPVTPAPQYGARQGAVGMVLFRPQEAPTATLDAMMTGDTLVLGLGDRDQGWLTVRRPLAGFADMAAPLLADCRF